MKMWKLCEKEMRVKLAKPVESTSVSFLVIDYTLTFIERSYLHYEEGVGRFRLIVSFLRRNDYNSGLLLVSNLHLF